MACSTTVVSESINVMYVLKVINALTHLLYHSNAKLAFTLQRVGKNV